MIRRWLRRRKMTPEERVIDCIRNHSYYYVPTAEGKTVSKETRQLLSEALLKKTGDL